MQTRHFTFTGVRNFRDFGGYPTRGGRVAIGKLYRSAQFGAVTAEDIARLDALGVKFLVDLRRQHERDSTPNKWAPARTVFYDSATADEAPPPGPRPAFTAELARAQMRAAYTRYPYEERFILLFRDLFRGLAEEGGPVIVHCAAGKDRTGIACALVLHMLGVDRETIFDDYLATNATLDLGERARLVRERLEPQMGPMSDEVIAPLVGVEAQYLQAALDLIEEKSGAIERYVEDTLRVTPAMQARMREHLLE